jgi:hypothetical protein
MSHLDRLSQWEREVSSAFPHLSRPQLQGLGIGSAAIAWSGCAGIVQISALLALVLGQGEQAVGSRAYASGIGMPSKKVEKSDENWM